MTKEEIGQIIKESRTAAGLTQIQVGEALNRPQTTIAAWEAGRSQPDANTLFELFRILGRSVDEAFGFQKDTPSLSGKAIKFALDYDKLDEYGRQSLEYALEKEQDRVEREAAFDSILDRHLAVLPIYKDILTDETGIDLSKEPEFKLIRTDSSTPIDQRTTVKRMIMANRPYGVRFHLDSGEEVIFVIDPEKEVHSGSQGMFTVYGFGGKSFLKTLRNHFLYPIQVKREPTAMRPGTPCKGCVIGQIDTNLIQEIQPLPSAYRID